MNLDVHLDGVEKYGFNRDVFPIRHNGHEIILLHNDGYKTDDDRLLFHFTLHCRNCSNSDGISARLPQDDDRQEYHVKIAKFAVFNKFTDPC